MGIYICLLLGLSCLGILIYFTLTSDSNFRLISKFFTSLCFLLIALFSYLSNPNNLKYFLFIFIGLILILTGIQTTMMVSGMKAGKAIMIL